MCKGCLTHKRTTREYNYYKVAMVAVVNNKVANLLSDETNRPIEIYNHAYPDFIFTTGKEFALVND